MAKILIVDDSRTSRKILRTILESAGHEVVGEAVDGVDGVNKFRELSPEITTLDITMPNMDGLEALKEIKKINANAKIIMVTAAGQQSKMVEAIKSGASEFVTKPFEADEISVATEKCIGTRIFKFYQRELQSNTVFCKLKLLKPVMTRKFRPVVLHSENIYREELKGLIDSLCSR